MSAFDLPTVEGLIAHYATLQGLTAEGWAITCEIVAGLQHQGEPAWAVVESDPAAKTAHVQVRDLAKTPIEGVDDPWTELKVTISHELWHPWVTQLLAAPTVENEERLVEAAAQAVVRSAGADARVMARSLRRSLRGVLSVASPAVRARLARVARGTTLRADQDRESDGKFAGGAGHIDHVGGPSFGAKGNATDPHQKAKWAAIKSKETGKTVYATPSAEPHSGGYHLATKIGKRDSQKGYSAVHPDGSITHHNGGASHGGGHPRTTASAGQRARGGTMDPKMVEQALEALIEEGQGDSKCAGILKAILASLASKGAGGDGAAPVEPDGDENLNAMPEAREETPMADDKNKPGAAPAGPPAARPMARVDQHEARARKAADSIVGSAIRARIREERTGGLDLPASVEASMLKMTDLDRFEERIEDIKAGASLTKGDGSRARVETGAKPPATPPPGNAPKYSADALIKEGINPIMAASIAAEKDPDAAAMALTAARARIASGKSPWPTKNGTGVVS